MPSLKSCAEWQNYTKSLPDCNPVEVDIANYHLRLKIHIQSGDFVGDETKVNALTTYCGNCSSSGLATANEHMPKTKMIGSLREVEDLIEHTPQECTSLFMTLTPHNSFSKLPISKEALLKLLTHYSVLPQFIDVLVTFGEKVEEIKENYGIYEQHIPQKSLATATDSHFLEVCYNLKYIAHRGDRHNKGTKIFTTRKTGIWAKYSPATNHAVWILVNPPERFNTRLEDLSKNSTVSERGGVRNYMDHHRLLLSCVCENWSDYISELEEVINGLNTDACRSSLEEKENQPISIKPSIEEAQAIQENREKLLLLSNFLEMNKGVIKLMKVGFESYLQIRRKNRAVGTTSEEIDAEETAFKEFTISLNRHLARATQHQKRVLFLVKRCDGLIALVTNVLASRDNLIIRGIQEKAAQNSLSMRIITAVALFFIPPTFIASVFSTDFLKVRPGRSLWGAMQCGIAYTILTLLSTAITIGYWRWYERKSNPDRSGGGSKTEVPLRVV